MLDSVINNFSLHGNWVDLILILLVIYFVATSNGFVDTFLDLVGFIFALFFSYKFYAFFGRLLIANFSFPHGLADAIGFFIAWAVAEIILYLLISLLSMKFLRNIQKSPLNVYLGYFVAAIQALFIYLFFISLVFALPVRGQIKQAILDSRTGPFFVDLSQSFEKGIKNIFGQAVSESLNFITVQQNTEGSVNLGFKLTAQQLSVDSASENIMLNLVNQERTSRGLNALRLDPALRTLARNYGEQMFEDGFFSHTSAIDGSSPADRANRAGIAYSVIGENLAFAPDVYVAHQGLMNSPGHRANILSPDYGHIGIGVINGGIYGRMFVQEFTN